MSEFPSVGRPGEVQDVRLSIARAAQATGIDFNYLLAQARLESNLDPQARADGSSAAGLYQFLGSTWLDTLDKHGAQYGLGWADAAINDGANGTKTVDPKLRVEIMALRYDPDASSLMAAELARDNQAALRSSLGREPDFAELYLAHFLGSDGASRFLTGLQQNPGASAADMFPTAAAANRPIFYKEGGAPRSLVEVMDHFRLRIAQANGIDGNFAPAAFAMPVGAASAFVPQMPALGPLAREFQETAREHAPRARPSMVETLRETFAGPAEPLAALPNNVRAAYSRLGAFGL